MSCFSLQYRSPFTKHQISSVTASTVDPTLAGRLAGAPSHRHRPPRLAPSHLHPLLPPSLHPVPQPANPLRFALVVFTHIIRASVHVLVSVPDTIIPGALSVAAPLLLRALARAQSCQYQPSFLRLAPSRPLRE
ncbi:hypothetical protein N657DRAFT_372238 [Parathielavia appendiculata]|uniref:Uncharacterized protein n=1 Tax=Parathielavia appendiculata TaxID=2587402 RepID=A0AAN6TPW8_9PEZI|nr:hypothetical protein N657DRAFT_372238 [Parathielavia appendiculata]